MIPVVAQLGARHGHVYLIHSFVSTVTPSNLARCSTSFTAIIPFVLEFVLGCEGRCLCVTVKGCTAHKSSIESKSTNNKNKNQKSESKALNVATHESVWLFVVWRHACKTSKRREYLLCNVWIERRHYLLIGIKFTLVRAFRWNFSICRWTSDWITLEWNI